MSVEELEEAVSNLSPEKFEYFSGWFDHYRKTVQQEDDEWDRQIERDAKTGRLDQLAERAREQARAGTTTDLYCNPVDSEAQDQ